ncbi:hypothetical protein FJT64_027589 [Amphibalanus amphitrite]|uniref:Uncharacterized protein n=1 Tax=Amphibalanus amphitrite TaxID=1232801 RepID=A0A6A4W001_AMPAM|nr:hypothetical protein FJT64_027589 [Amphibalanus amphitrite]
MDFGSNEQQKEWIEELENFLESDSGHDTSSRQKKTEMLLHSITQALESPEYNNDNAEKLTSVPKKEAKSDKTSHVACLMYFALLCIVTFAAIKYGYCQGKSLKLCWNNNIQDWIYPILRAIRLIALPIIQYFPSITDIHEETCLIENPFYWDQEVDCSLCQDVAVVTLSDIQHFEELFYHKGVPVIVQDAVPSPVYLPSLRKLYAEHRADIAAGSAVRLVPAPPGLDSLDRLLRAPARRLANMEHCIQWRLLRVSAVRHLRELFVRPYFITKKTEVSLHRYIYLCGDQGEQFHLPMTEFANVWISQHSGTRRIRLTPSSECSDICRPLSALLRPGETLFYNWRYWRATSLSVDPSLLTGTTSAWDAAEGLCSSDTSPASTGWERWVRGKCPSSGRVCPPVYGERSGETAAPPAGGQGSGGGEDAAAVTCTAGVRAGGGMDSCIRSPGVSPSPPEPTVGITFVGSFY